MSQEDTGDESIESADQSLIPDAPTPGPVNYCPSFPVVGIGASAGGLDAFTQLLHELPADTGMGLVLVPHLAPGHSSSLAEILSRATRMPVTQATDRTLVEPDHVYVIPPGKSMVIANGVLALRPRDAGGSQHVIDVFMLSLAADQGPCAIGVILSGTATDGTTGLEEIKAAGGITLAQDHTAQHEGMPSSAIATGCVDFVLSPQEMARELARIALHPQLHPSASQARPIDESSLAHILDLVQAATNVDFTHYKSNTLSRRIARRMVLKRLNDWAEYARLLEQDRSELNALFQDLLIGVTGFFRNPEMFETFKADVLPRLLQDRTRHDPLRIWVLGCSSGEEAYSYGIAIAEFMSALTVQYPVQIFATDLNADAIEKARAGVYRASLLDGVSQARVRGYFVEVDESYRVSKPIRDLCVFARHNALTDPPFSRMDIVSCRNMLIYFEPVLQQRILTLVHYALKPRGYLVLGHSESLGGFRDLFTPIDVKHKIFEKRAVVRADPPVIGPAPVPVEPETAQLRPAEPQASTPDITKAMDRILISRYAPAAVLVSAGHEIMQVRGDTTPYLAQPSGRASLNILKMAREGLLVALRGAILRARRENTGVREFNVPVKTGQGFRPVNIEVLPMRLAAKQEGACLVMFEEARSTGAEPAPGAVPAPGADTGAAVAQLAREDVVERLTQELAATREYLQSVIEQQEAANEELQSANEEAQSSNEELQSINEELETSKEEIQSANEELATVNEELYERNQELGRVNNDLVNLLASMETAVVMVGPDLRIRRFTPVAQRVFNLIAADIGRPIGDIQLNLSVENLDVLLKEAIDTIRVCEREVEDRDGRRCLLRIRPYRTLENKIEGAVIMVFDADTFNERYLGEDLVARRSEALLVLESDLRVRSASQAFYEKFETTLSETERKPLASLCDGRWDVPGLAEALDAVIARNESLEDFEFEFDFGARGRRALRLSARRLSMRGAGGPQAVMVIEDVTDQRRLKASLAEIARMTESERQRDEFLAMIAHELRNPMAAIQNASGLLGNPSIGEQMRDRINKILGRQVRGLARLVEDLLDTARITHGKIELKTELQELGPLVESSVESVRANAKAREQSLELKVPPYALYVEADAERLNQVLSNLLNNASKFTPPGGSISVAVEFVEGTGSALIRVRDNGEGIRPDQLPKIFDLFMQADNTLGRVQGGLGIGLTVARRLVQMHGGTLEAHSEGTGKGSEFVVRLPARRLREAPVAKPARKRRAASPCRVLVVDDNADAAEMLATALQLAGHVVEIESHSVNALPSAMKMKPDAIVLDIGMPELDGYELARRLRREASTAGTLLIALTGYGKEGDRLRATEAGFDHHIVKPADPDELAELIGDSVAARRPSAKPPKKR